MSPGTRDTSLFAVALIGSSAALFAVWPAVTNAYRTLLVAAASHTGTQPMAAALATRTNLLYLIPAVALMFAARGSGWQRKTAWMATTLGAVVLVDLMFAYTGSTALFTASPDFVRNPLGTVLTLFVFHTSVIVWPLGALLVFVGGRPEMLWRSQPQDVSIDH